MIALLLAAAWVVWGFALLRLLRVELRPAERVVAGVVVGLATGGWVLYLIARALGTLGPPTIAAFIVLTAVLWLVSRRRSAPTRMPLPRWFVVLAALTVVVLTGMNLFAVLSPSGGQLLSVEHVWADTPFHTSIASSFAYRDHYPPDYPLALGQPLSYPFLVDFLSGALLRFGAGLRASLIAVNVAVQAAFLLGLALIVLRLSASVRAAVLAVVVFFLLGNLGWLAIPGDVADAGGFLAWLSDVPWSYTGETAGVSGRERLGTGLYLGNPVFLHLLPRRSAAFGMAVGAVILLLLEDVVRDKRLGSATVLGVLAGVLPRVHAHTAIALTLVAAAWAGAELRRGRPERRRRLAGAAGLAAGVAAVIALPEIVQMRHQTGGFFALWPGWTGEPREAFTEGSFAAGLWASVRFWVLNAGVLLLLLVPAWRRADRRLRRWYAPFIGVWLLGFLVRTQPWEWDNNNHFVWWQVAGVVVVAPMLAAWLGSARRVARLGAGVALVGLCLGGVLSLIYAGQHRMGQWSEGDVAFAERVRQATPRDAVVLTSNGHGHPVIGLSGRQTVMGYWGWFTAHGLDGPAYEASMDAMLAGDIARMRRLGIDYVVLGPWEQSRAEEKGYSLEALRDPSRFALILRSSFDGREWVLLRLREA